MTGFYSSFSRHQSDWADWKIHERCAVEFCTDVNRNLMTSPCQKGEFFVLLLSKFWKKQNECRLEIGTHYRSTSGKYVRKKFDSTRFTRSIGSFHARVKKKSAIVPHFQCMQSRLTDEKSHGRLRTSKLQVIPEIDLFLELLGCYIWLEVKSSQP